MFPWSTLSSTYLVNTLSICLSKWPLCLSMHLALGSACVNKTFNSFTNKVNKSHILQILHLITLVKWKLKGKTNGNNSGNIAHQFRVTKLILSIKQSVWYQWYPGITELIVHVQPEAIPKESLQRSMDNPELSPTTRATEVHDLSSMRIGSLEDILCTFTNNN